MRIFKNIISKYEGTEKLLYSDQSNPYESIYIRAKISNGLLTITDSECEHGPDGGWSHRTLTFDKINTELALKMLQKKAIIPSKPLKECSTIMIEPKFSRKCATAMESSIETRLPFDYENIIVNCLFH